MSLLLSLLAIFGNAYTLINTVANNTHWLKNRLNSLSSTHSVAIAIGPSFDGRTSSSAISAERPICMPIHRPELRAKIKAPASDSIAVQKWRYKCNAIINSFHYHWGLFSIAKFIAIKNDAFIFFSIYYVYMYYKYVQSVKAILKTASLALHMSNSSHSYNLSSNFQQIYK